MIADQMIAEFYANVLPHAHHLIDPAYETEAQVNSNRVQDETELTKIEKIVKCLDFVSGDPYQWRKEIPTELKEYVNMLSETQGGAPIFNTYKDSTGIYRTAINQIDY
jgi:hypothetical protein